MRIGSFSAGFAGLSLLFTAPALAQTPDIVASGFRRLAPTTPVGVFDAYATLSNGDRIVFDGTNVDRYAADGTHLVHLGTLSAPVFASLVVLAPDESFALVGESSNGLLYTVDLGNGGFLPAGDLDFNYDAVFEDATHAIVSASSCVFCGFSDIYRLDVTTGNATLLATVSGPSGPLALASDGTLYYGRQPTVFPPPPGSFDVVTYTAAQLASGVVLGDLDAQRFASALDGASSMEFDPVYGHLLVSETPFTGNARVSAFDRHGARFGTVVESTGAISNLELFAGAGSASFQAYQPENVTLLYRSTDYTAFTSTIASIVPQRPIANLSGPGTTGPGRVTFTVTGAVPGASYLVLLGPRAQYNPNEFTSDTGVFLFHTGMNVVRRTGLIVPTDLNGTGSFQFFNPGTLQGTRVFQAVIRNASNVYVGTSTAALL